MVLWFSRMPFDWRTPFGYFWYLAFYGFGMVCVVLTAMPTMCLLVGCCWLFSAFAKDITNDLYFLNMSLRPNSQRNDRLEFRRDFCQLVQLHSDAKELSAKLWIFSTFICELIQSRNFCLFVVFLHLLYAQCSCIDKFNVIFEFKIMMYFLWVQTTICAGIFVYMTQLVELMICKAICNCGRTNFKKPCYSLSLFLSFLVAARSFELVWMELSSAFGLFYIPLDFSFVWTVRNGDQPISAVQHRIKPV